MKEEKKVNHICLQTNTKYKIFIKNTIAKVG